MICSRPGCGSMPSPTKIPRPPAFKNCWCTLEMPLTMPAMAKVSSGRPHCLPLSESPPAFWQPAVRLDFITFQRVASERAQSWETVHCGLYGPSYAVYGAVNRGEEGWAGIKTPKRYVHIVDSGYRDRKGCAPEAGNSPGREVNDD